MSRKLQTFEDLAADMKRWRKGFDKYAEEHIVPSLRESGHMNPDETLQEYRVRLSKDKDFWPRHRKRIEVDLRASGKIREGQTLDEYLESLGPYEEYMARVKKKFEKELRDDGKIKPSETFDEYMDRKWSKYGL